MQNRLTDTWKDGRKITSWKRKISDWDMRIRLAATHITEQCLELWILQFQVPISSEFDKNISDAYFLLIPFNENLG